MLRGRRRSSMRQPSAHATSISSMISTVAKHIERSSNISPLRPIFTCPPQVEMQAYSTTGQSSACAQQPHGIWSAPHPCQSGPAKWMKYVEMKQCQGWFLIGNIGWKSLMFLYGMIVPSVPVHLIFWSHCGVPLMHRVGTKQWVSWMIEPAARIVLAFLGSCVNAFPK